MSSATERARRFANLWLFGGYAFLYLPIVTLVVFSFNASKMASIWGGFSTQWYAALVDDSELIAGFWLSLRIALMTACASVVLGTLDGVSLAH